MLELDKIIQHDVSKPFPLPDECIDCVITSPPYWGLRDYGEDVHTIWNGHLDCKHEWINEIKKWHSDRGDGPKKEVYPDDYVHKGTQHGFCSKCGAWKGQLGLEPYSQMYIGHLVEVFREVKRVLKKSGSFYLNLGDSYCGSGCGTNDYRTEKSRSIQGIGKNKNLYKTGGISAKLKYDGCWLQPKQLLGIPWRVAISLQEDGWILRNCIIWHKVNPMPSSVKDRLNTTYEHVFHFVKNNNPIFHYNIKTGKSVDKKPSELKEGIDWGWKDCQHCMGTERVLEDIEALTKESDEYIEQEKGEKCNKCKGSGKIKISYWKSMIYYYDLDAIREPHESSTISRFNYPVRHSTGRSRGVIGGEGCYKTDVELNPAGKNPGDVLRSDAVKYGEDIGNRGRLLPKSDITYNPNGKNPGGVFRNKQVENIGGMRQAPEPNEPNAFHPAGKNPGDTFFGKPPTNWYRMGEHESGKNPGDFFEISTQPFTGYNPDLEHFAVFPEELLLKPLKSSCPRYVCKRCGKPKIRIVERNVLEYRAKLYTANTSFIHHGEGKSTLNSSPVERATVGWSDCGCNDGFTGGVVLDPFCGRGTVGKVARSLGLHYILFDIKPEYCELSRLYIGGQKYKIHKGQSNLDSFQRSN